MTQTSPPGEKWRNLPRCSPSATYADEVEGLVDGAEGALEGVVVVRGDDEGIAGGIPLLPEYGRDGGEVTVEGGRLVVGVENRVELVIEGTRAIYHRDVLGDAGEVAGRARGIFEVPGEVLGQF